MKKFDLLKVLAITFLVVVLLSWVIPAGGYSNGVYQEAGSTVTIGLYDFIRTPAITIATFIQYGLVFLAIGGFYGVLNKTGVYSNVVNAVTKKWEKNKKAFLIIATLAFALLSSLTSLSTLIFVLVPFFVTVLMKLGYKKMPAFAATVGALLVGQIGTTLGFNIWGYLAYYFDLKMTTMLGARIVLFFMVTALFIILVLKGIKEEPTKSKNKKEAKEELAIPLYEENTSKKSIVPLIVIVLFMFIILGVGMYNWYHAYDIQLFANLHDSITDFKIGEYPIFANLLGSVAEIGFWGNYDLVVILILGSFILGWIYNVKFNEVCTSFKDGMKEMLPTAFYAMLASVIFACMLNMNSANFVITVVDKLLTVNGDKFSLFGTIGSSAAASFAYNDFYTLASTFGSAFGTVGASMISIMAVVIQAIYGFIMLIAPTSIFLLAGLKYMEIPYKEWIKYIWKFALIIFGVIVVVGFILTLV